eukprot:gene29508-39935_t
MGGASAKKSTGPPALGPGETRLASAQCQPIKIKPGPPKTCQAKVVPSGNVVAKGVRDNDQRGLFAPPGSMSNGVMAGKKFAVKISMQDEFGNEVTTVDNWGKKGTLEGETEMKVDKAVWTHGCLTYKKAFSDIKLSVRVDGLDDACTTELLRVIPHDPAKLVITQFKELNNETGKEDPATPEYGSPLRAGEKFCVDVEIRDKYNNVVDESNPKIAMFYKFDMPQDAPATTKKPMLPSPFGGKKSLPSSFKPPPFLRRPSPPITPKATTKLLVHIPRPTFPVNKFKFKLPARPFPRFKFPDRRARPMWWRKIVRGAVKAVKSFFSFPKTLMSKAVPFKAPSVPMPRTTKISVKRVTMSVSISVSMTMTKTKAPAKTAASLPKLPSGKKLVGAGISAAKKLVMKSVQKPILVAKKAEKAVEKTVNAPTAASTKCVPAAAGTPPPNQYRTGPKKAHPRKVFLTIEERSKDCDENCTKEFTLKGKTALRSSNGKFSFCDLSYERSECLKIKANSAPAEGLDPDSLKGTDICIAPDVFSNVKCNSDVRRAIQFREFGPFPGSIFDRFGNSIHNCARDFPDGGCKCVLREMSDCTNCVGDDGSYTRGGLKFGAPAGCPDVTPKPTTCSKGGKLIGETDDKCNNTRGYLDIGDFAAGG